MRSTDLAEVPSPAVYHEEPLGEGAFKVSVKALEQKSVNYVTGLKNVAAPRRHALPLTVKALDTRFGAAGEDEKTRRNAGRRLGEFGDYASRLAGKYYREVGENACAVYNAATGRAGDPRRGGGVNSIDGMRKRVGGRVEQFAAARQPPGFGEYLAGQPAYLTRQGRRPGL